MSAGHRDNLVTFQHATKVENEWGDEEDDWSPLGQEWVAVFYGRGDERRQAAMEQGSQAATFQALMNPMTGSVTIRDRIEHNGAWDVTGIAPDTPKRGFIEFTAVRAS